RHPPDLHSFPTRRSSDLGYMNGDYSTQVHVARDQPVRFSHEHHVAGLGIDCRYCHTTVESSNFAGIPATKVCMTCHSQIWTNARSEEHTSELQSRGHLVC